MPALDTLFLAFPISGPNRVTQYVGRVSRPVPAKTSIEIHDYHDTLHPLTRRMHLRRLATFKTLGFTPTQGAQPTIQRRKRPDQSPGTCRTSTGTESTPSTDVHISESGRDVGVTAKSHRPSLVTDDYWLYADDPNQTQADGDPAGTTTGKWQLFVPRQHVDDVWTIVAGLVRQGELGPSAKVATATENPNTPGEKDMHVIAVYANDWRDVADVRRILKTLRREGLARGWVHFKRDRETLAGTYAQRGRQGVSVWNARPGNHDEISTKWTTGRSVTLTTDNSVEIVAAVEILDQIQHP